MFVSDWMTQKVFTVRPNNFLMDCKLLYKMHCINRLPVVEADGRLVGIISSTDLMTYAPKLATGPEILEAMDLLAETRVSEVMIRNPHTITASETIEDAAMTMLRNNVSCLPVIDSKSHVVGIITRSTIFQALLSIIGTMQYGKIPADQKVGLEDILAVPMRHPVHIVPSSRPLR